MKLEFDTVSVEKSGKFQSQNFDIGDKRIILEILRGKMYSNPIQTICQEIMSNARDAHIEAGKESVPIVVKLPNKLEPDFYIKDFGLSISPDRMSDVFIKYGASTKRTDNRQAGGFGLGCKSPFSYTDSFSVICVTLENGQLVKRQYIAHIDATGLGEMSCVKEEVTTEPQGTTVVITPKMTDYQLFVEQVTRCAAYWPVRPKILGVKDWQWPKFSVEYKGKDWEIHDNRSTGVNGIHATPYALIEGIPYPIKSEHLFKTRTAEFPNFRNIAMRLHFKIGELPITANREEIDYQERSIRLLEDRLNAAFVELRTALTQSVTKAPSLKKAIVAWNAAKRHHHFGHLIVAMYWKPPGSTDTSPGILISGSELSLKGIYANLYYVANNEFGFNRDATRPTALHIDDATLVVEDDGPTTTVSRQRLANLFASHQGTKRVYLVSFYRKIVTEKVKKEDGTEETRQKIAVDEEIYPVAKKVAETQIHWKHLDTLLLSTYEKKKIDTKKTSTGPKPLAMRYIAPNSLYVASGTFDELSADATVMPKYYIDASGNDFIFTTDTKEEKHLTKRELDNALGYLQSLSGQVLKLHLATTRHKPLMEGVHAWVNIRTYIDELVKKEAAKCGGKLYTRRRGGARDHFQEQFIKLVVKNLPSITDQNSIIVKYFKNEGSNPEAAHLAYNLAQLFDIKVPLDSTDPMEDMYNKIRQQYPLFCNIQFYYGERESSAIIADLISYVNMKNEINKKAP